MIAPPATDPITAEIIRNALVAITDEMKTNLMRTAYNPIIYESLDFTVGLFDADGETTSIGLGLPMFIRGLSDAIKEKLAFYGHDGIEPGDILLTNDAYIMGSHLNHMVFTLPIFHAGKIVAFASSMAHWADIGGQLAGTTQDIYSEGLQLPIVKIYKRGIQDDELTRIIRTNVRFPKLALGDFRAQIAAIKTGEARYSALLEKYGLSEVSPQVQGYFNSGKTAGISAAEVAFKCITTPTLYPINAGAFRALTVVLPLGRVVSATKPAAMRKWMTVPMTIVDTVFRALAPALPDRVAAAHHADLNTSRVFGINPQSGRFFATSMGLPGGGWGAKHDSDGMSAVVCINDGDTHNTVIEAKESKMPVVFESYGLRRDSGGPGRWRGGLGAQFRIRALCPMKLSTYTERTHCAPWGLNGGVAGAPNGVAVETAGGAVIQPSNGKLAAQQLQSGDVFIVRAGGGGGYGDPRERPRVLVRRDVKCGYVSRESALRDYGMTEDDL
jgi:N-methylhydantoinase B